MTTTRTADVVIIGGGVTGVSTAFHLTRGGVRNVIVVDKGVIASGGTGKSSACVRQHYSTAETCRMIRYSLEFFQHFAERVDGESCGFTPIPDPTRCGQAYYDLVTIENRTLENDQDTVKDGR